MTREEAIKLLECSATELAGTMMQTDEQTAVNQLQRYVDAYDMAISALREQENLTSCNKVSNKTNADHIRAMSDEELANFLAPSFTCYACPSRILCDSDTTGRTCSEIFAEWLKQPYKEAPNDPT